MDLGADDDIVDDLALELVDTDYLLLSEARALLVESGLGTADVDCVMRRLAAHVRALGRC